MSSMLAVSQTYSGRDKLMRTAGYLSVFLTGACNPQGKTARDLATFAKHLSAARTMMRFFDDIPMWTVTKASIFSKEKDLLTKILGIIGNVSIQLYFPIEKIAWAGDNGIIPVKSSNWWTAGIGSWAIFLAANILKFLRSIQLRRSEMRRLIKQRKLESPERSSDSEIEFKRSMADLQQKQFADIVNLIKLLADLVMAVNWLPKGFLWATKISPVRTAFFGCISSAIGLLQLLTTPPKK